MKCVPLFCPLFARVRTLYVKSICEEETSWKAFPKSGFQELNIVQALWLALCTHSDQTRNACASLQTHAQFSWQQKLANENNDMAINIWRLLFCSGVRHSGFKPSGFRAHTRAFLGISLVNYWLKLVS